jgi:AMMECR1 domain-containing protein
MTAKKEIEPTMPENVESEVTQQEAMQSAPDLGPVLDMQDLAQTLNLVFIAIKRGAYERSELRGVLDITDKLEKFLEYQAKARAEAQATQGEL